MRLSEGDTTLILLPGIHQLTNFTAIQSVSNVSIMGQGPDGSVVITCNRTVGLAFINVTNLSIENVTLDRCAGLKGDNLLEVSQMVQQYVQLSPYSLPLHVARAVIIAECYNVYIKNVAINGTVGVGLTALNVLGDSYLTNVMFYNNSRYHSLLDGKKFNGVAGSAIFYFGDSVHIRKEKWRSALYFDNNVFLRSGSLSRVSRHVLVDDFFENDDYGSAHNGSYPLDGAGGLALLFARYQEDYQYVSITNSSFLSNMHQNGGCLYILFHQRLSNANVSLDGNFFKDCKGGSTGGGLLLGYGYPSSDELMDHLNFTSWVMTVRNTKFYNCQATWGGGSAVVSLPSYDSHIGSTRTIKFENCTWFKNSGTTGSALAVWEGKYHGVQRKYGLEISVINCQFFNNTIEDEESQQLNSAVVNLDAVSVKFNGRTFFEFNQQSCIGATRSEVQVYGEFIAQKTQVIYGGVLDFRDTSFLVVKEGASIQFAKNQALWRGGAISVSTFAPWPLSEFGTCFLHFGSFRTCAEKPCYNLTDYDRSVGPPYTIHFDNNTASFFGNEIFGATFQNCPWMTHVMNETQTIDFIANNLQDIIRFSVNLSNDQNAINGYMEDVYVHPSTPIPEFVMPGQQWTATVTIVDGFNHSVPAVNTLRLPAGDGTVNTAGEFSVDGNIITFVEQVEHLRFVFNGTPGDRVQFQFLPTALFQPAGNFSFTFSECYAGFIFMDELNFCKCDEKLLDLHRSIRCHVNGSISHGSERWIGFKTHSENNATDYLYVASLCIFDYCKEEYNIINDLSNDSEQCNFNRAGILCGGCKDGYSRVLGTSACKDCSHLYLLYLLLYFASGIIIIVCIFAFQITITTGYLNGIILYANIVTTFSTTLFPRTFFGQHNPSFIFISFLNLAIGFETCFYDGMTQLHYTALKLTYPFYLLLIIGIIALIAKVCPNRLLQADALHPVQVTATVLFISFASLFQSVLEVLGVAVLEYHGHHSNETNIKWLYDPNVDYGTGLHAALLPIAILLLVFIVGLGVIVLVFFKPLLKVKGIGRLLSQKWWPFFDAFQNPYVSHLRFWVGIQLLFRVASLSIANIQQLSTNLRYFSLFFMIVLLAIFTVIEAFLKPFKGVIRNILDIIFLLDLLCLLSSSLYYNLLRLSIQADQDDIEYILHVHLYSVQVCLDFAVILIGLIIIGFLVVRFGLCKLFVTRALPKFPQKVRNIVTAILSDAGYRIDAHSGRIKRLKNKRKPHTMTVVTLQQSPSNQELFNDDDTELEDLQSQAEYNRYRDSILENATVTMSRNFD